MSSVEHTRFPDSWAGCCGGSQAFHGLSKTKLVSLLPPGHQGRLYHVLALCRKAAAVPRKRTTDIQNVETTTITASAWLQQDSLGRSLRAAGAAPGLSSEHRRPELPQVTEKYRAWTCHVHTLSSSPRPVGMREAGDSYLDL